MSFVNKTVLVTGASSGIGAATAIEFAKEGATVALVGRNEKKLLKIAEQIDQIGAKYLVIKADVSEDQDTKRIIEEVIRKLSKLDVLVNNAGLITFGSILDGRILEAFDSVMKVNIRAHINITNLAAPHLIKSKGNIVNVSSVVGTQTGTIGMTPYCITKAALSHFSRCAAFELAEKGVRVNTVSPGPVATDILENAGLGSTKMEDVLPETPLKRVSDSVEVANVILFLASAKANGITGSEYIIDNGWSVKN
ncbi:3-oxoacyl-[acyl-carrier-protein] reductase FabG-like [Pieris rapae]|uniref:3-oxoacyl-[acyl-carrier-protein] reductase FabG-like n=1 Tax=Pieris rapae TaxID=64459 RepID=UPI000B92B8C5|nr:3-oxoacyl-[acyl-carrier-protein] reductase FabG-like [Pieris rapae]